MQVNSVSSSAAAMNQQIETKTTANEEINPASPQSLKDSALLSILSSDIMTPDVENPTPGTIHLSDIEQQIVIDKGNVDEELKSTMLSLGIDRNAHFTLATGRSGRIIVNGDFKGKERLEKALNNSDSFNTSFKRMSANSSFLEAAKRSLEFQKEYAVDPKAAVVKFAYLLNDSTRYDFSFSYENGEGTMKVDVVTGGVYRV